MQVQIVATNIELAADQRSFVEQRIAHGLDRFAHEVRTVEVVFSDENGPKGGDDTACHVKVHGDHIGTVVSRSVHDGPEKAASDAVRRVVRQVSEALDRQADRHRRAG